jgi:AcrR family transcriptional regulator
VRHEPGQNLSITVLPAGGQPGQPGQEVAGCRRRRGRWMVAADRLTGVDLGAELHAGLDGAEPCAAHYLIMVAVPKRDRKAERREATRREILGAAWEIAHEGGLTSVTLREIAARIGMQPPSLYSHFASKNAIYDAMFGQAWHDFHAVLERKAASFPADPRGRLVALAFTYFDFATSDLERHQLMDMPMMRDFTPSEEAYRPAVECYEVMRSVLNEIGIRQQADLDIYTALTGGFVNQQLANDPKGDRWRVLLPRALSLFADDLGLPVQAPTPGSKK